MFIALAITSVLLAQDGTVTVAEGMGEEKLFILGKNRVEVDLPFRHHAGIVGWTFDLTADCRLVVARSSKKAEGVFPTVLELHRVDRDGKLQFDRVLAASDIGISSPAFSADGQAVAYIDGSSAVVLELKSGVRKILGDGRAAMWDDAGGIVVWRINDRKCQVLDRYGDGVKTELDLKCIGEITLPVSSGVLPKDAPLPIIGRYNLVERLLGTKSASSAKGTALRGAGVACQKGLVFESTDDLPISFVKNDSGWGLVRGSVCERPVAHLDEKVMKTQHCSVAR